MDICWCGHKSFRHHDVDCDICEDLDNPNFCMECDCVKFQSRDKITTTLEIKTYKNGKIIKKVVSKKVHKVNWNGIEGKASSLKI